MTRRIVLALVGLLVLAALGWLIYRATRPAAPGNTATVERGRIEATVDALGSLALRRQVEVVARTGGTVQTLAVQAGERVAAGALLVELASPEAREGLVQAESALALRSAELEQALAAPDQASIDLAVARLKRATVLRQNAQADYDAIADQPEAESSDEALALAAAKLEYQVAQSEYDRTLRGASELDVERLRASVAEAQRALQRSQERIEQLRLHAPADGIVMELAVQVGQAVYANGALLRLADPADLQVRADVSELDIAEVAAGQAVVIWLDAFPGALLQGEVTSVLPTPSTARGMTTYVALIELEGVDLALRPGMGANVKITTGVEENALLIPRRAVRTVEMRQLVRVVEGGRVSDAAVTTGLSNGQQVQVLSGLAEGQQVLVD
ncbi:MAG: efflux RND transporter periplasmic adaptor subunit [Chloroflexi bacterium]|nr:efflux RND transporter periplasmic adaptor subunit [Chloroflexota bacterium]